MRQLICCIYSFQHANYQSRRRSPLGAAASLFWQSRKLKRSGKSFSDPVEEPPLHRAPREKWRRASIPGRPWATVPGNLNQVMPLYIGIVSSLSRSQRSGNRIRTRFR